MEIKKIIHSFLKMKKKKKTIYIQQILNTLMLKPWIEVLPNMGILVMEMELIWLHWIIQEIGNLIIYDFVIFQKN